MKNHLHGLTTAILLSFIAPACAMANVTLPQIFNDHMVLQQRSEITVWGWGKPREEISVTTSWDNHTEKTVSDSESNWQVKVQTPAAGGPFTITIKGYNTIELTDILIGEVWLCSGQSNMEWTPAAGVEGGEEAIRTADQPKIRLFTVNNRTASDPQIDLKGDWSVCTPETMKHFSAVGYFFARRLREEMDVPIGLINSSWGGTPVEVWMNAKVIAEDPVLAQSAAKLTPVPWGPVKPGRAYNAMIAPLIPFRIAGALWYQGEANTANGDTYAEMLNAMITSWRREWGVDFPFLYVQIAPYEYGKPEEGVVVRDEQRQALATSNTAMVVISDIGNIKDIHPRNKIDVGTRLANWALTKAYGKAGIPVSGPLFREAKAEGKKVRIYFDYAENGLFAKGDGEVGLFELAGEDGHFVPAEATIAGTTVVVKARGIRRPTAVRFAWSNTAEPNLVNKEGLPASCFKIYLKD